MQSCCFGFEQHLGRWAVFSAAFHHTERAPRVTSSLTAKSPTIRSFKTSLVSIQGFSPPVSCARGRLVKDGGEELRQQYRKMLSAQSRNLVLDCPQLRLVLLGKTGTGKTRLISRVCGKPYQVRLDFGSCLHLF